MTFAPQAIGDAIVGNGGWGRNGDKKKKPVAVRQQTTDTNEPLACRGSSGRVNSWVLTNTHERTAHSRIETQRTVRAVRTRGRGVHGAESRPMRAVDYISRCGTFMSTLSSNWQITIGYYGYVFW